MRWCVQTISWLGVSVLLSACGGGGGTTPPPPPPPVSYTVTTNIGVGGNIAPTSASVNQGETASFTISPSANFTVNNVSGCGGTLTGNTFTTGAVTGDCTVTVAFKASLASVSPLYTAHGVNWNDYVKNDGATQFAATDTAADGSETGGYSAVIHGGEVRVVEVTGKTNCTGLTAQDALAAFDWVCVDTSTPVRMVSTGLKADKNLSDLIDFGSVAWRSNRVTVNDNGVLYGETPVTVWWSNPVIEDNDGSDGYDMVAGDVRIIIVDPQATYTIGADKVALVIEPSITLTGTATTNERLIHADTRAYLWIEGALDATQDSRGVSLESVEFSVLRNIQVSNGSYQIYLYQTKDNLMTRLNTMGIGYGVYLLYAMDNTLSEINTAENATGVTLDNAIGNRLSNITSINGSNGMLLTSATENVLSQVVVSNNAGIGMQLNLASNNTVTGITAANNGTSGVLLMNASENIISQVTAMNNNSVGVYIFTNAVDNVLNQVTTASNSYGIMINTGSNNIVNDVTAVNNTSGGIYLAAGTNNTLSGVTVANNSLGIYIGSAMENTLANITAANNYNHGINVYFSSINTFMGRVQVGNNGTDCIVTAGSDPGLNSDCTQQGSSDFGTPVTGISVSGSFMGKVVTDDSANASDTTGAADFPADPTVFDWSNFENAFRTWGIDGSAFPATDHEGRWTTGMGRIWDWSLESGDSVIRNLLPLPSGDNTLTHIWSTPGTTTFLRNAIEILGDGVGNDNGLCESNETCLYTPNNSSYQGHGALISAGAFTDGVITGVTLMKYGVNGR